MTVSLSSAKLRRLLLSIAAVAFCLTAGAASAVPVKVDFDLTGKRGFGLSHDYHAGGVDLTVSAGVFDKKNRIKKGKPALVVETPFGLGVQSQFFDTPLLDGRGRNEVAMLAFSEEVTLHSLTFSFADGNDDFRLFVGDGGGNLGVQGDKKKTGGGGVSVFVFSEVWINDLFGIGAKDFNDEFLLKGVSVLASGLGGGGPASPVPLPAPLLMLGSLFLLGGFISYRRRSAKA